MSQLDEWIELCKDCKYLPEPDLKKLCDMVSLFLFFFFSLLFINEKFEN